MGQFAYNSNRTRGWEWVDNLLSTVLVSNYNLRNRDKAFSVSQCIHCAFENKKAVLPQANHVMLQPFCSV